MQTADLRLNQGFEGAASSSTKQEAEAEDSDGNTEGDCIYKAHPPSQRAQKRQQCSTVFSLKKLKRLESWDVGGYKRRAEV